MKLDPETLVVETFEARDFPPGVNVETGACQDTYQTTGYWICAADCGSMGCASISCVC